jgi:tetratricopeptide (TPR) repeat protein
MEKPEAAYAEYQEALRFKPDYEVVHLRLWALLFDAGQDEERAIAAFRKSIALNPNNADSLYHLGCVLLEKGDHDGAIREFREAKRIDPARVDARQNLGAALLNRDTQAAIREFHELIEMSLNFAHAHSGLERSRASRRRHWKDRRDWRCRGRTIRQHAMPIYGQSS